MKLALHWKILIGLALGVGVGLALNRWSGDLRAAWGADGAGAMLIDFAVNLNRVLGEMFKRSLQFIAAPIILFALILAIGSLGDLKSLGRIGGKTVGIFACTATLSVIVGLVLVNTIRPGSDRFIGAEARERLATGLDAAAAARLATTAKSISPWDLVRDAVPTNPFDALARGDMLQIVVLALLLGIALTLLPAKTSGPVLDVVRGLSEAFTAIVRGIMHLAPVGVFCLITPTVATLGLGVLASLGAYCVTVLLGLAIIQLVIYPAVVKIFTRMPLWGTGGFFPGIAQVQMVAFSSSSSAATLPVTIANVRDRLGVPADITGFVCAMGAKINMDGTALMQAIATVFLAQFYGNELGLAQQASIVLTAVVAAIGTPGIPSGGMVMLVIVLQTYGVNPAGIAMILAVDRVLDMCRTIVNVTGDAAVAVAVAGSEKRLRAVGTVERTPV
ncbi:MAG: dicarboxylate/amino acid:cation symporter [Phycisphaerae bacterium]|nr:dicarboxylate/amino acid:cation symporter [Phycisphaerae bacterium]